jgi:predicted N-formylglutamate amidohydrolase
VMLPRPNGGSDFVIVVDHAGKRIPRRLGALGLLEADRARHIAWDIGAWAVALTLAERLDATLIGQAYSRLVIDCNRDPSVESAMATLSETTPIPGNMDLSAAEVAARRTEVFDVYHARLRALLDERQAQGRRTVLIALHSMTDVYKGVYRPMQCAVLYNKDARFSRCVLKAFRREPSLVVGENEPYSVSDDTDYTVPHHAERRGLPHAEIEMRQDLIVGAAGQAQWAERLARVLTQADLAFLEQIHGD